MKYLLLIALFSSCASIPDKAIRSPLEREILRFRSGLKNPSNRACIEWDAKNACLKEENKEYDLRDEAVRKTLNDLSFICKVSGERYKIDPTTPQLRRDSTVKCGLFGWGRCTRSEYIPVENVEFLRQANTKCFSAKVYSFDTFK